MPNAAYTLPARVLLALLLLAPRVVRADWPTSTLVNLPICTATGQQLLPRIATDGSGGAIIVWHDSRVAGDYDIYAQRVLSTGVVDPGWPLNGAVVCSAAGRQSGPRCLPDGAGGAMVAWWDFRAGATTDIYAQHILSDGQLDPGWPTAGRAVCTAAGNQQDVVMVPDGTGGSVLAWRDFRDGATQAIHAGHLLATGELDPAWPLDGRLLMSQPNTFTRPLAPAIAMDAHGGAVVAWEDFQGSATAKVRLQRVRANGAPDPAWPGGGLFVCAAADSQQIPVLVSDGAGGAYVAWRDFRAGATSKVYLQHVRADGVPDPNWTVDGKLVCGAFGMQQAPALLQDGSGGTFIVWNDSRLGSIPDLYAQHVLSSGANDPGWPTNGRGVCLASGTPLGPLLVPDGTGGFLVAWNDDRSGASNMDMFAQHVLASGAVDPQWASDGQPLSSAAGVQQAVSALADGSGGLIAAWMDSRAGSSVTDVYAQRVRANGQLGGSVVDVPASPPSALALAAIRPNPWRGGPLRVDCELAGEAPATLELLDVAGRRLARVAVPPAAGGARSVELSLGVRPPSGVYQLRLRQRSVVRLRRVVVLD